MAGRKPKDTALKTLAGAQPCRVNAAEPKPASGRPECPGRLDDDARAEWDRITGQLERMGILTEADGFALAIYCEAWARKRLAEVEIAKVGCLTETATGALKANPAVAIAKACDATMLRILSAYGLTAADRSKVRAKDPKSEDKLAALLARRSKA